MVEWDGMEAEGRRNEKRRGETQVGMVGEVRGAMEPSKAEQGQGRSGKVKGGQGRSGEVM